MIPVILFLFAVAFSRPQFFQRTMVVSEDRLNPSNNLATVLDPHLNRAVNSTLYTRARANQLLQEVFQYHRDQFGIDFSTGSYNSALGSYHLPVGSLYPYGTGYSTRTYVVIHDTKFPQRDNAAQPRIIVAAGYLALLHQEGSFPAGSRSAGLTYKVDDLLSTVEYNVVVNSTFTREEIIPVYSEVPTFQRINSLGRTEQYVTAKVTDSAGKVGQYLGSTQVLVEGTDLLMATRGVLTWN